MRIHMQGWRSRRARATDAVFFFRTKRDGDIQVECVYEHSARADHIPRGWRGPFASELDAARAAEQEAQ